MTIEEQINEKLDARSIDSKERANRVVNYINAIDIEDFILGRKKPQDHQEQPENQQEKSKNQERSEQCKEDIPSNEHNTRRNQLESDLWRQLKRVSIPVFNGNKRAYELWKAAFMSCFGKVPTSEEYKLLQLRQYLSGEALKVIESLGHSATAYQAAKERL